MNKNLFLLPISVALLLTYNQTSAQKSQKLIENYYQKSGQLAQKSNRNDHVGIIILNEDNSKSLGANIVNVQQTYNGLRVYKALGKVIIKEDKIISERNDFSRNLVVAHQKKIQERFSEESLKEKLGLQNISWVRYLPDVYFEKNKEYVLAKELFVSDKNSSDIWHVIADAGTGEILSKNNSTIYCRPGEESLEHAKYEIKQGPHFPVNRNSEDAHPPHFLTPTNASYNVFPLPVESPTFGSRSIVNNPWDLTASPEGWHSDGTNNYTNTRGNNVYAYSDIDDLDVPGHSPDGGSALNFNFTFDEGRYINPLTHQDAAITNLFYMNNKMHDIFYKFGFTEPARNFQINNFGKGGIEGDALKAEAFDGSALNNAAFYSGYELETNGVKEFDSPIMQMYLWTRAQTPADPIVRYKYNSPATMVNRPIVLSSGASFGNKLATGQAVTGDLALPTPIDACANVAAGSLTGKIAVVQASTACPNLIKLKNVQDAGAIGAVYYHLTSDTPPTMGGGNNEELIIPAIIVGKTEGDFLVNEITGGTVINTTLKYDFNGFKHSGWDNGIVAHEYGHGISNRLTADGYDCLYYPEQMGEGWSDFFALMLTTRPGDTSSLARSMGTYTMNQLPTDLGIRPAKYSPDFGINNYTYGRTNSAIGAHAVGFIWATMLWDLAWKYIEKYGYNSDVLASTTSGNAKVLQIVMDGLKLQTCNPTFIDGRNAILQADAIGNASADKCLIWKAFAKRGLGVNASYGNIFSMKDQVEDFTIPAECNAILATGEAKAINNKFIVFPNPTYDEFFVGNIDQSFKEVKIKVFDMAGKLIFSDSRDSGSKKAISTKDLQKGVYMVNIQQGDKTQTEKLIVK